MGNIAIQVEGIGKRYQLGERASGYQTARESIASFFSRPLRGRDQAKEEHWALSDVSFDVKHGDVVGIVGSNGAGKSTLLKILSRITKPTKGSARVSGRVGSLLEVGTGFHPELSGRENIYMNGAILGMSKAEIDRKFDEIVDFAEVEKFLDTPVKRYSSGMQLRLGFAVAAHLEPEIMIVDEVLAVGDAAFQKKCIGKMQAAARQSRTVLFVSHNMPAVLGLCTRAIVLQGGTVNFDGSQSDGVHHFLQGQRLSGTEQVLASRVDRRGTAAARFTKVSLVDASADVAAPAQSGRDMTLCLKYESDRKELRNVQVGIDFRGAFDERLLNLTTSWTQSDFDTLPPCGEIHCRVPRLPLAPGRYTLDLYLAAFGEMSDYIVAAYTLDVSAGDFYGSGKISPIGYFFTDHQWSANGPV